MAFLRFSFGALAFLGLGLATACSSSSSGASPDSGSSSGATGDGSTTISPLADGGGNPLGIMATCGLLSGVGGGGTAGTCASGQTCCTMLAFPPSASCVPTGSCSGISNECMAPKDCGTGQVCCAGAADGGAMPAMDASMAPGGLGGFGNFDPASLSSTCQSSCTATQMQYCTVDTDCPSGQTCQAPGGAGGLGALGGFITLPSSCAAPRPDAGVAVDSGSPGDDSGSTGSVDAAQE
jgi:hypothetical protein